MKILSTDFTFKILSLLFILHGFLTQEILFIIDVTKRSLARYFNAVGVFDRFFGEQKEDGIYKEDTIQNSHTICFNAYETSQKRNQT